MLQKIQNKIKKKQMFFVISQIEKNKDQFFIKMRPYMKVLALLNGMIGGIILLLPKIALDSGWLMILPISIVVVFCTYISCMLCIGHLHGNRYADLDQALQSHLKGELAKKGYNWIMWFGMHVVLVFYFYLICDQWQSFLGIRSELITIINGLLLLPLVEYLGKYKLGEKVLAYGIASILFFFLFVVWAFMTRPPSGHIPAFGQFSLLFCLLAQGFIIQVFFIPILRVNLDQASEPKLVQITLLIGWAIYMWICYGGSWAISGRSASSDQITITQFFIGSQAVRLISLIYLLHLYSVFPQFLFIAQKRMDVPHSSEYSLLTLLVCTLTKVLGLKLRIIVGGLLSLFAFFNIVIVPAVLHFTCVSHEHEDEQNLVAIKESPVDIRNPFYSRSMLLVIVLYSFLLIHDLQNL